MAFFKPLHVAAALSVAVHVAVVSPAGVEKILFLLRGSEPVIDLSLVAAPPPEAPSVRLSKAALTAKPKPIAYPEFKKSAPAKAAAVALAVEKPGAGGPVAAAVAVAVPKKEAAAPASGAKKTEEREVTKSSDLLKNPKKAKALVGYFGAIREKIHDVVRKRYSGENAGEGTITLYFVLRSDGRIDRAAVLDGQSAGSGPLKEFAVQCLRNAGPFGMFPAELEAERISFNLTILFQDL